MEIFFTHSIRGDLISCARLVSGDCIFTGLPVAQPSYKMGLVFPSGTNRTLACSARAQDISVCLECVE